MPFFTDMNAAYIFVAAALMQVYVRVIRGKYSLRVEFPYPGMQEPEIESAAVGPHIETTGETLGRPC